MSKTSDHNQESGSAKLYRATIPHVHYGRLEYLEILVKKRGGGSVELSEDEGAELVSKMDTGDPVQYIKFYDHLKAKYNLEPIEWGVKDSIALTAPGYSSSLVFAGALLNRVKSGLGTAIVLAPLSTLTNMVLSGGHIAAAVLGGVISTTAFAFLGPIGIVTGAACAFCIYKYFEVQESKTLEKRLQAISKAGGTINPSDDGYNKFIESRGLWGKVIGHRAMYNQYLKQEIKNGLWNLKNNKDNVENYINAFNDFFQDKRLPILQSISEDHYLDHLAEVNKIESLSKFLDIFSLGGAQKFPVNTLNSSSNEPPKEVISPRAEAIAGPEGEVLATTENAKGNRFVQRVVSDRETNVAGNTPQRRGS